MLRPNYSEGQEARHMWCRPEREAGRRLGEADPRMMAETMLAAEGGVPGEGHSGWGKQVTHPDLSFADERSASICLLSAEYGLTLSLQGPRSKRRLGWASRGTLVAPEDQASHLPGQPDFVYGKFKY